MSLSENQAQVEIASGAFCRLLAVPDDQRPHVARQLVKIQEDYEADHALKEFYGAAGPQRKIVTQVAADARKLQARLAQLTPHYFATLQVQMGRAAHVIDPDLLRLDASLAGLASVAETLVANFHPARHRPTNLALWKAVDALLQLIARLGHSVDFSWDEATNNTPRFTSVGAQALVAFARTLNPRPTDTAVANMAEAVRQGASPDDPLYDLVVACSTEDDELEMSLLPGRREELDRKS